MSLANITLSLVRSYEEVAAKSNKDQDWAANISLNASYRTSSHTVVRLFF